MLFKIWSALAFVLLCIGFFYRRKRKIHIGFMMSAFILDLGLVIFLEFNRDAIAEALTTVSGFVMTHIMLAVATLFLYLAQIILGTLMTTGIPLVRSFHRNLGWVLLATRASVFATSLFVSRFI